jgi:multiple sugar transport system substrate-binding protein
MADSPLQIGPVRAGYLYNLGGEFLANGRAAFNSPEAIGAFAFCGTMLGEYGPPGVTNMSWPQAH